MPRACSRRLGEDMAALGVGGHLDFIDGQELDLAVERHRLDRADEPAREGRQNALLARDQGDVRACL